MELLTRFGASQALAQWAEDNGLTPGVNDALDDDPGGNGVTNLEHFAFNTDPFGNDNRADRIRGALDNDGGGEFLTLTLPVRSDADFFGLLSQSATVDGIVYTIVAGTGLSPLSGEGVEETRSALDTGLPTLDKGWSYRTFRTDFTTAGEPKGFMRVELEVSQGSVD